MGYKVKRIMVGDKQVRPAGYEKSIDLRGKTLAQVQAEGFDITTWNGSYTLDNSGLSCYGQNNGVQIYYSLPRALNTSNIIEINSTGYSPGSLNCGNTRMGITSTFGASAYDSSIQGSLGFYNFASSTGITYNNSLISTGGGFSGGNFNYKLTVDLSTGNCTYVETSPNSFTTTATLTSSQISDIINCGYIIFSIVCYASTRNYIYTVNLKVS